MITMLRAASEPRCCCCDQYIFDIKLNKLFRVTAVIVQTTAYPVTAAGKAVQTILMKWQAEIAGCLKAWWKAVSCVRESVTFQPALTFTSRRSCDGCFSACLLQSCLKALKPFAFRRIDTLRRARLSTAEQACARRCNPCSAKKFVFALPRCRMETLRLLPSLI